MKATIMTFQSSSGGCMFWYLLMMMATVLLSIIASRSTTLWLIANNNRRVQLVSQSITADYMCSAESWHKLLNLSAKVQRKNEMEGDSWGNRE